MSVSDEILKRMADSYRRMRNTVRYLLGNLHGFDPKQHAVKPDEMLALDRWALARTRALQAEITEAYRKYTFHLIYQKVHNFCIVDLGGFYLDVIKDRLYVTGTDSRARRSAQTAMYHIAESMVRWLAPILSFTAEEIWSFLPGKHSESVFLETWHTVPETPADKIDWTSLIQLRSDVVRELEKLRDAGSIGAPLDAEVDVYLAPDEFARFSALGEELRFLFITSEARVHEVATPPENAVLATNTGRAGVWIALKPSSDPKCIRCRQRRPDVGRYAKHPELCGRCVTNVDGPGEQRKYV
jgi:isoleucyl-tRNA synthetase